jgi:hypothetical protein
VRLGFAAKIEEAAAATTAAAAAGAEPPDTSGLVSEADISSLMRCHALLPGEELLRQFDPVTLVPLAVMDTSPEGILVQIAGDTLESEFEPPPAFVLRPGVVVDATAFLPRGACAAHGGYPVTLRAGRGGEYTTMGGKVVAEPPTPTQVPEEQEKQLPSCLVLTSTSALLNTLRENRPTVFESIRKALASAKPGFLLGRGQPYVAPKAGQVFRAITRPMVNLLLLLHLLLLLLRGGSLRIHTRLTLNLFLLLQPSTHS